MRTTKKMKKTVMADLVKKSGTLNLRREKKDGETICRGFDLGLVKRKVRDFRRKEDSCFCVLNWFRFLLRNSGYNCC